MGWRIIRHCILCNFSLWPVLIVHSYDTSKSKIIVANIVPKLIDIAHCFFDATWTDAISKLVKGMSTWLAHYHASLRFAWIDLTTHAAPITSSKVLHCCQSWSADSIVAACATWKDPSSASYLFVWASRDASPSCRAKTQKLSWWPQPATSMFITPICHLYNSPSAR